MQVAVRCSCGSWAAIDVVVEVVASSCSPDLAVPDGQCDAERRAFLRVSNVPLMTSSSHQNHSRHSLPDRQTINQLINFKSGGDNVFHFVVLNISLPSEWSLRLC